MSKKSFTAEYKSKVAIEAALFPNPLSLAFLNN